MRFIFIFSIFIFFGKVSISQERFNRKGKLLVDSTVYGKWNRITGMALSNNGEFFTYYLTNNYNRKLVVQSLSPSYIRRSWKVEIQDGHQAYFTSDSRVLVFRKGRDSIGLLTLRDSIIEYLSAIKSFKFPKSRSQQLLVYQEHGSEQKLVVRNLKNGNSKVFRSVLDYSFNDNGTVLVIQVKSKQDEQISLVWINLHTGMQYVVWKGERIESLIFAPDNMCLAFIGSSMRNKQISKSLWYYSKNLIQAEMVIDSMSSIISRSSLINGIISFNSSGTLFFFSCSKPRNEQTELKKVYERVDIWSYTDYKLQSQQLLELGKSNKNELYAIDLKSRRILRIGEEGDYLYNTNLKVNNSGVVLLRKDGIGDKDELWNYSARSTISLFSTLDGSRQVIAQNVISPIAATFRLSPLGRYVIYYDAKLKDYFSYDIFARTTTNVSQGIDAEWTSAIQDDMPISKFSTIPIAGWLENESGLLIYDRTDIFLIDPTGKSAPINLTKGVGRKENIVFRLAISDHFFVRHTPIKPIERLLLSAFSINDKRDGYYTLKLGINKLDSLMLDHYMFSGTDGLEGSRERPVKAYDVDRYLLLRQNASTSPNIFGTSDFKRMVQLTFIDQEKNYNWLTSELLTWKTFDGSTSHAILYKPENFDPQKKYPVIFFYYERFSEMLHEFGFPKLSEAVIDIPTYVSNEYIVCVPDIHYPPNTGQGPGAYNTVVSLAKYLSGFPFVDSNKMGLNGHSRGGFQTDYLISRTNIFAAAISGAGYSNLISSYGGVRSDDFPGIGGTARATNIEYKYQRIGTTLWDRPDLFIENSPVFSAHKVTTPVLLMNNKNDGDIPFAQGVEFFTALRRLGKRAWMLQYDEGGHAVDDYKGKIDFTFRMKQFFDHYLKDSACPRWMLYGIPAKDKGIDNGFELVREKDPGTGKWLTPKEGGLLTDEEREKVEALKRRRPLTVTID